MERKDTILGIGAAIIVACSLFLSHFSIPPEPAQIVSAPLAPEPSRKVRLLVVGDIMLDRLVRRQMHDFGERYPFLKVQDFLQGSNADMVVGNLEGPITGFASKTVDLKNKVLQFTFATSTAPLLQSVGFTHLGLANNHTMNFGKNGLEQTHAYLSGAGVVSFGDPKNEMEISKVVEVNGLTVGLVGYHAFEYGVENVLAEIETLRPQVDLLFVFPHWGNEYELVASENQTYLAHNMIDLGADVVFGAHPHVVQNIEVYNGKIIFYSLGNFVFDQDFSKNTKIGLAVIADFDTDGASFSLQPIANEKGQASLIPLRDIRAENLFARLGIPSGTILLPFSTATNEAYSHKVE